MSGLEVDSQLSFPSFRLRAHLTVQAGERIALVGHSGCGKSTLLKWIAGILESPVIQAKGVLRLGDKDLLMRPAHLRNIGYVPQDQVLFPALNVLENVTFGLRARKVSVSDRNKKGMEALESVGLENRAQDPVQVLSGGEQQRIALLRALIWGPELLLLDEPFSGLDPDRKRQLQTEWVKWIDSKKIPVLWVTHDLNEIKDFATAAIALREEGNNRYFER